MNKAFRLAVCAAALYAASVAVPAAAASPGDGVQIVGQLSRAEAGGPEENMSRSQLTQLLNALRRNMAENSSAPNQSASPTSNQSPPSNPNMVGQTAGSMMGMDFSGSDFTEVSNRMQRLIEGAQSGLDESFNPTSNITMHELALHLMPHGDVLSSENLDEWAQAYIEAATEQGLIGQSNFPSADQNTLLAAIFGTDSPNSAQNEQQIEHAVEQSAGGGASGPGAGGSAWSDFPAYAAGQLSPAPPPAGNISAIYEGRLAGAFAGTNEDVSGSLWALFDLNNSRFEAVVDLSYGVLTGEGSWSGVTDLRATLTGQYGGDPFNPGSGNAATMNLQGAFWGMNAQEIGGNWDMTVNGVGNASGKFGAARIQ